MENISRYFESCRGNFVFVQRFQGTGIVLTCCNEVDNTVLQVIRPVTLSLVFTDGLVDKDVAFKLLSCVEADLESMLKDISKSCRPLPVETQGQVVDTRDFYEAVKVIGNIKSLLVDLGTIGFMKDSGKVSTKLFSFWKRINQKQVCSVSIVRSAEKFGIVQRMDSGITIMIFGKVTPQQ